MTEICFDEKSLGEYNDKLKQKERDRIMEILDNFGLEQTLCSWDWENLKKEIYKL